MSESEKKSSALVTILLALIPVIGGLLTIYLQNQPQLTALQLTATADARFFLLTEQALTAQAGERTPVVIVVTNTPEPVTVTDTPVNIPPTATSTPPPPTATATPSPRPGEDLAAGCISTALWEPFSVYPVGITAANGCWQADNAGIYALHGWRFSVHQPGVKVVAFHTPIGTQATITFDLKVTTFEDREDNSQIDLFFGFASLENNIAKGEFLIFRKGAGNNKYYLVSGDRATVSAYANYGRVMPGTVVHVRMVRNGNFVSLYLDDKPKYVDKPLPAAQLGDLFWVGYSIPHNADVEAEVTNFLITVP